MLNFNSNFTEREKEMAAYKGWLLNGGDHFSCFDCKYTCVYIENGLTWKTVWSGDLETYFLPSLHVLWLKPKMYAEIQHTVWSNHTRNFIFTFLYLYTHVNCDGYKKITFKIRQLTQGIIHLKTNEKNLTLYNA